MKDQFPINVNVVLSYSGRYYRIEVPSDKMSFEVFQKLGSNLSKEEIQYGKDKFNIKYKQEVELLPNDVSISHYDYKTGECNFIASTKQDVINWLNLYKDYVQCNNLKL